MSDYWSETGKLFSGLIEKPKMTEKLLKKPPPKYIYDIVMNTMKKTGFPKGLFTENEENPKYFEAEARNKLEILQKVIDITKIVGNKDFEIKCTNILKGEEPAKTNVFLRQFYECATNGKDNSKFIEKYLAHKKKKEEAKASGGEAKPKPKPAEKKIESSASKAATGIIKESEDDNFDESSKPLKAEGIKMSSGAGMKIDKRIFVHDIEREKKDEGKAAVSNVDLEAIKEYVQTITKSCNPIGKIIEFLGEDIDGMNKELQSWINENKSYKERYDEEIKKTDETLLPLQNELLELEDSIRDELMQIKSIKSRLIKNERVIQNLINNVISFKGE